jgi:hypothetical protein
VTGSDPRSYARGRSYERVARSSSTDSLEEGTNATRRWTAAETRARVAGSPSFRYPSPDESTLQDLVLGYEAITRDPVRRPAKRNFIASCYRVHGPALLDRVRARFIETGTATNLLGHLRTAELETLEADTALQVSDNASPPPRPARDALPGLTYGEADRPRFGADPKRRYDRRPSNPDAASFFSVEELGVPPRRSPTAEALDR